MRLESLRSRDLQFLRVVAFWVKIMENLKPDPGWVGMKTTHNHTLLHTAQYSYTLIAHKVFLVHMTIWTYQEPCGLSLRPDNDKISAISQ